MIHFHLPRFQAPAWYNLKISRRQVSFGTHFTNVFFTALASMLKFTHTHTHKSQPHCKHYKVIRYYSPLHCISIIITWKTYQLQHCRPISLRGYRHISSHYRYCIRWTVFNKFKKVRFHPHAKLESYGADTKQKINFAQQLLVQSPHNYISFKSIRYETRDRKGQARTSCKESAKGTVSFLYAEIFTPSSSWKYTNWLIYHYGGEGNATAN